MLIAVLLLFCSSCALSFRLPRLPIPSWRHVNSTALDGLPVNLTTDSKYWTCFQPSRLLRPTIYRDCYGLTKALLELDPSGEEEFLFSPRAVADVQLPYYLRWGTCVLDLRGVQPDAWDMFPISLLANGVLSLTTT